MPKSSTRPNSHRRTVASRPAVQLWRISYRRTEASRPNSPPSPGFIRQSRRPIVGFRGRERQTTPTDGGKIVRNEDIGSKAVHSGKKGRTCSNSGTWSSVIAWCGMTAVHPGSVTILPDIVNSSPAALNVTYTVQQQPAFFFARPTLAARAITYCKPQHLLQGPSLTARANTCCKGQHLTPGQHLLPGQHCFDRPLSS